MYIYIPEGWGGGGGRGEINLTLMVYVHKGGDLDDIFIIL